MGYWETVEALRAIDAGRTAIMGAADVARRVESAARVGDILPTFVGPEAVLSRINELDGQVYLLDHDVSTSAVARDVFKSSWAMWVLNWEAFRNQHAPSTLDRFMNGKAIMDQVDRYDEQFRGWRDAFIKEGGQPIGPAPGSYDPNAPRGANNAPGGATYGGATIGGWALGAMAVGGLIGAAMLVKAVKS